MPNADAFETRLSVVEHDVAQLRERAARTDAVAGAAHVLAAGADHDVSEIRAERRAHLQVLHALRETQLEHGERLDRLESRFDGLEREMREGFAVLGTGMAQITALLTEMRPSKR
ncbi:MAG: hypothetical protein ACT4NY_24710 [Pseudonocardiales bacterium]